MNTSKKKQGKLKIKNVTIHVTRDDINKGEMSSIFKCPIARAIARKKIKSIRPRMPLSFPYSRGDIAKYQRKEYEILTEVPNITINFMHRFDGAEGNKKVKPFSFVMHLLEVEE